MDATLLIPPPEAMKAGAKGFVPGKYPGMPRSDYDCAPGVSHSMLQTFKRGQEMGKTRRLLIGDAVHAAAEDPEASILKERYHLSPRDFDLVSREGKDEWNAIKFSYPDKIILRKREADRVRGMWQALMNHPVGRAYICSKAEKELSVFQVLQGDKTSNYFGEHDTLVKGRLDQVGKYIWDLKTTHTRDAQEFRDSIVKFNYHTQMATYRELWAALTGEYKPCKWLCVHDQEPYDVFMVDAEPMWLSAGLKHLDTLLTFYERYGHINLGDAT